MTRDEGILLDDGHKAQVAVWYCMLVLMFVFVFVFVLEKRLAGLAVVVVAVVAVIAEGGGPGRFGMTGVLIRRLE